MRSFERLPQAPVSKKIAILGAGIVGTALATAFVSIGHEVTISNSRGPETLRKQEKQTGAIAKTLEEAIAQAEILVLATPTNVVRSLGQMMQSTQPGTVVLDVNNYYPSRDGHVAEIDHGMADSEWAATVIPLPVVKAFNNIIANNLGISARPRGSPHRVALPVAGDDEEAVKKIMQIVDETGFDAFYAGGLGDSWRQQSGQPGYCVEPNLKQLPQFLARANREAGPINRDKTKKLMDRLPADYSSQRLLRISRLSAGLDLWKPQNWLAMLIFGFHLLWHSF